MDILRNRRTEKSQTLKTYIIIIISHHCHIRCYLLVDLFTDKSIEYKQNRYPLCVCCSRRQSILLILIDTLFITTSVRIQFKRTKLFISNRLHVLWLTYWWPSHHSGYKSSGTFSLQVFFFSQYKWSHLTGGFLLQIVFKGKNCFTYSALIANFLVLAIISTKKLPLLT